MKPFLFYTFIFQTVVLASAPSSFCTGKNKSFEIQIAQKITDLEQATGELAAYLIERSTGKQIDVSKEEPKIFPSFKAGKPLSHEDLKNLYQSYSHLLKSPSRLRLWLNPEASRAYTEAKKNFLTIKEFIDEYVLIDKKIFRKYLEIENRDTALFDLVSAGINTSMFANRHPLFFELSSIFSLKSIELAEVHFESEDVAKHFSEKFIIIASQHYIKNKARIGYFGQQILFYIYNNEDAEPFSRAIAGSLLLWLKQNGRKMFVPTPSIKDIHWDYVFISENQRIKKVVSHDLQDKELYYYKRLTAFYEVTLQMLFLNEMMRASQLKEVLIPKSGILLSLKSSLQKKPPTTPTTKTSCEILLFDPTKRRKK